MLRKIDLTTIAILLLLIPVNSQHKRTTVKPSPESDAPADEILFSESDYYRSSLTTGWRLASRSNVQADGSQQVEFYDRSRIKLLRPGIKEAWFKSETRKKGKAETYSIDF